MMDITDIIKKYYPNVNIKSSRVIGDDVIEICTYDKITFFKYIDGELYSFKKDNKINNNKLHQIFEDVNKIIKRDSILNDILKL